MINNNIIPQVICEMGNVKMLGMFKTMQQLQATADLPAI